VGIKLKDNNHHLPSPVLTLFHLFKCPKPPLPPHLRVQYHWRFQL